MRSVSVQAAALPEINSFDALHHASSSFQPSASAPAAVIGKGGYTLTVPGAEGLSAPYIESTLSSVNRPANGPMVVLVGMEMAPDVQPAAPSLGRAESGKTPHLTPPRKKDQSMPVVGLSLTVCMALIAGGMAYLLMREEPVKLVKLKQEPTSVHVARIIPIKAAESKPTQGPSLFDPVEPQLTDIKSEGLTPRRVKVENFVVLEGKAPVTAQSAPPAAAVAASTHKTIAVARPVATPRIRPDYRAAL